MYIFLNHLSHRTHQLRVHMAHIGHPILGDTMYPIPQQFMDVIAAAPSDVTASSTSAVEALTSGVDGDPTPTVRTGSSEEEEMLELLQPLEGRIILTADSAPTVGAPRVDTAFPRLCLHALRLSFTHPVTKAPTTLCALTTDSHMVQQPSQLASPPSS